MTKKISERMILHARRMKNSIYIYNFKIHIRLKNADFRCEKIKKNNFYHLSQKSFQKPCIWCKMDSVLVCAFYCHTRV